MAIQTVNKKGEEAHPIPLLVGIILVVFFLIFIFLFLFDTGRRVLIEKIKIIFPSFNLTQPPHVGELQILGYNLETEILEYYDGITWHAVESQTLILDDKTIKREQAIKDFIQFYYNRTLPETLSLENRANKKLNRIYSLGTFTIDAFRKEEKGNIIIQVAHKDYGRINNYYLILTPQNELLEQKKREIYPLITEADLNQYKRVGTLKNSYDNAEIFIGNTNGLVIGSDTGTHFANIHGLKLPFELADFGAGEERLQESIQRLGINSEIILNDNYTFMKGFESYIKRQDFEEYDLINYQLFTDNRRKPIDAFLTLHRVLPEGKIGTQRTPELRTAIHTRDLSSEEYELFSNRDAPELEIIEKVSNWRDTVTKKPIKIRYNNNEGYFCAQKINVVLTVNLAEPKSPIETC